MMKAHRRGVTTSDLIDKGFLGFGLSDGGEAYFECDDDELRIYVVDAVEDEKRGRELFRFSLSTTTFAALLGIIREKFTVIHPRITHVDSDGDVCVVSDDASEGRAPLGQTWPVSAR